MSIYAISVYILLEIDNCCAQYINLFGDKWSRDNIINIFYI